jgi:hypothetical protein
MLPLSLPGASTSTMTREIPAAKGGTIGEKCCPVILPKWRLPHHFGDLLHAANLWHGTDGFTSPPKEGVLLRIFSPLKIWRLWPGLNSRTWVLKASTLPLDHWSRPYQLRCRKTLLIFIIGGAFHFFKKNVIKLWAQYAVLLLPVSYLATEYRFALYFLWTLYCCRPT